MNSGLNNRNRYSSSGYLMKMLMEMTKNFSVEFNVGVLVDSIVRYTKIHFSLFGKYNGELMPQPSDEVLKKISGTFSEFLKKNDLSILIPLLHRTHTSIGYGYLDEVGALYGLMWNSPKSLITYGLSALGEDKDPYKMYILKNGFENVWNTIMSKEDFNVRYFSEVTSIHRNSSSVTLYYKKSDSKILIEQCDFLIWTPPMPELINSLSDPSKDELNLFKTLTPHFCIATLMKEKGVIRNHPITFYQESLDKKIDGGVVGDCSTEDEVNFCSNGCPAKMEDYNKKYGTERHTTVFQLAKEALNEEKSNQIARDHYEKGFNASDVEFLSTITWEYFYKWSPDELSKGNHWKVFKIQGLRRTWYAGASVIFESIKSVLEYNELLIRQMLNSMD